MTTMGTSRLHLGFVIAGFPLEVKSAARTKRGLLRCTTRPEFSEDDSRWMRLAIEQAKLAFAEEEVPIGCVLVSDESKLIALGRNQVESSLDCTCHAEMVCIRNAMKVEQNWRLLNTTLYTTLEPCLMCLGAIQLARVKRIVFGADDHRLGAVHSWVNRNNLQDNPKISNTYVNKLSSVHRVTSPSAGAFADILSQ